MDKHKTDVLFRKFKTGELIAIFPGIPGTNKWYKDCMSYMSCGHHGACDLSIINQTLKAKTEDIRDLVKELEALGYNLNHIPRITKDHITMRKLEIERITS